jgi:hypothetical protein
MGKSPAKTRIIGSGKEIFALLNSILISSDIQYDGLKKGALHFLSKISGMK